jgi:hypothetical protein
MADVKVRWNSQIERIIAEQGERALCYAWLHTRAEKLYTQYYNYIAIPTIVLSTIAGTASIGSQTLFQDAVASSIGIGAVSLTVGILNTVSTHFGWAKRSEAHRQTAVAFSKIHRFILVELSLPRRERMEATDMLKVTREQLDRLQETSPQIPDSVIQKFKLLFGTTTPELSKPEVTNGLDPIVVYVEGSSPHEYFHAIKTSSDGHTPDTLQTSSSVRPQIESEAGNSHTSTSSCSSNTT